MAAFESSLLLSDEDILKLGVKEHSIEVYRRWRYQYSFGVHTWYDALKDHTFKTETIDLSFLDAKAILDAHHSKPTADLHTLRLIQNKIDAKLAQFPNGAFVKLDTRSPKDVPVYAFKSSSVRRLINEELSNLSITQLQDDDEKTAAFVRATNKKMRILSGEEALELLIPSTRVSADLGKALEYGETLFTAKIVIREWIDEVPNHPEMEFRGFVHKGELNALTQYFSNIRFPYLVENKMIIQTRVLNFFNTIKHLIPHESYVIDFFVLQDKMYVIELNPFHIGAGAGLFSWKEHRQLFLDGPFEFRVASGPPSERQPYESLSPFWQIYVNRKCTQLIYGKQTVPYLPFALLAAFGIWRAWMQFKK